jgi:hypothetical protein
VLIEVICFEDRAFYAMVDKVIAYVDSKRPAERKGDKWISGAEAMQMLRITSKTTLQKFRNEGKIRCSQIEKKIILYDADSILEFLEDYAFETF